MAGIRPEMLDRKAAQCLFLKPDSAPVLPIF